MRENVRRISSLERTAGVTAGAAIPAGMTNPNLPRETGSPAGLTGDAGVNTAPSGCRGDIPSPFTIPPDSR